MSVLELVIVLAVIWAFAHMYFRHSAASEQARSFGDKLGFEIGKAARNTSDTFQGQHGKAWQVIGLLALLVVVWMLGRDFMSARLAYVVIAIVGFVYLFRLFSKSNKDAGSRTAAPPVPPPLPPEARMAHQSSYDSSVFESRPSKGNWFAKLLGIVFVVFLIGAGCIFVIRLETKERFDRLGPSAIFPSEGYLFHAVSDPGAFEKQDGPDVLIPVTPMPKASPQVIPAPALAPLPATPNSPVPPNAVLAPSEHNEQIKIHKSSTGVELATLTTEAYPSEAEARQGAMLLAAQYLSQVILQKGLVYTNWRPSLNWTSRNFIESLEIEKVERGDLSVFVGHADVRVPDEKKVEQIWNEYIKDKAAGRSLLLLKVFAGAVFMAGGFAVLLRLGTGRHVAHDPVSLKKGWFAPKEPAKK